ncbi:hypothetical protein [Plantibacter sp. YIM 135347]|uniref:hypothetical protein n=1 Tax=Plantibacter sp. YIM 135347 TaxID=3423919 RepID=UPI003D34AEDF
MRRRTAAVLALTLLALTLGLAACSGGGTPSAGGSPSSGSGSSGGSQSYEQEFDDWNLKIAKCLRDQGMDVADPEPGTQWTYPDAPGADEAVEACYAQVGAGPTPPNQPSKAERVEQGLKLAKCLRDKGYDVKDPDENGSIEAPDGLSGSLAGTGCENL